MQSSRMQGVQSNRPIPRTSLDHVLSVASLTTVLPPVRTITKHPIRAPESDLVRLRGLSLGFA